MSRALDVGCVNDIAWRPTADGSTVVSSAARIVARGDGSSPIGRGFEAALTTPFVGDAMRAGMGKALELAVKASVDGSVSRVTKEYSSWAPGAAERVRKDRARGLQPAALEDAAAAAAADEELRRIRAENAELRRLIAAAEEAGDVPARCSRHSTPRRNVKFGGKIPGAFFRWRACQSSAVSHLSVSTALANHNALYNALPRRPLLR